MDMQLYFEQYGSGEPLILLHGNGDSHAFFAGQIPYLEKHFTVYALDTRGHGQSPLGTKPFTLSQFADDLKDFLDERGIERAHLLGASDGANIAMLFALHYPERVRSLVLNSGNLFPDGLVPGFLEEIRGVYASMQGQRTQETGLLELMLFEPHISPQALNTIAAPTLVIAGDDDLILPDHTRLIASQIPHAKLVFLSGTHSVAQEQPDDFNAALGAFYNQI